MHFKSFIVRIEFPNLPVAVVYEHDAEVQKIKFFKGGSYAALEDLLRLLYTHNPPRGSN